MVPCPLLPAAITLRTTEGTLPACVMHWQVKHFYSRSGIQDGLYEVQLPTQASLPSLRGWKQFVRRDRRAIEESGVSENLLVRSLARAVCLGDRMGMR